MTGLVPEAGWPLYVGATVGLLVALVAGAVNGILIAYLNLPPFVVR